MSPGDVLDTSLVVSILKIPYRRYVRMEQAAIGVYYYSLTHRLAADFCEKLKVVFMHSCFYRNSGIKKIANPVIIQNSLIWKYIRSFYKKYGEKLTNYLKICSAARRLTDLKTELYFLPAKLMSIFIVITTIVNVVISLALKKPISIWGYLMRGLFLSAGIPGMFCNVDWPTLKKSSLFFKNTSG